MSASSAPSSIRATSLRRTIAPSPVGHDQVLELVDGAQVGVREQVDLHQVALRPAHRGEVVVAAQRRVHVAGREVERGQAVGVDPHSHGDLAATLDGHALHAGQGRELWLERAQQPIGDGRHVPLGGREAQVERRVWPVGALDFDHRRLGLFRQLRADLLQARGDLGQRRRAAVVQLQTNRDGAEAGPAGRLDVIDAADLADTTRSIGVVRKPRTVSALAP